MKSLKQTLVESLVVEGKSVRDEVMRENDPQAIPEILMSTIEELDKRNNPNMLKAVFDGADKDQLADYSLIVGIMIGVIEGYIHSIENLMRDDDEESDTYLYALLDLDDGVQQNLYNSAEDEIRKMKSAEGKGDVEKLCNDVISNWSEICNVLIRKNWN